MKLLQSLDRAQPDSTHKSQSPTSLGVVFREAWSMILQISFSIRGHASVNATGSTGYHYASTTCRANHRNLLAASFIVRCVCPGSNLSSIQICLDDKRDSNLSSGRAEKHPLRALCASLPCRSRRTCRGVLETVSGRRRLHGTECVCGREGHHPIRKRNRSPSPKYVL